MKMPEKDPQFWAWLSWALGPIQALLYAVVVAGIRILRDGKEKAWKRILLEMLLCGLLAQAIDSGFRAFFDLSIPTVIAASVGLLGPEWVRMKVNKVVNKRIEEGIKNDDNVGN